MISVWMKTNDTNTIHAQHDENKEMLQMDRKIWCIGASTCSCKRQPYIQMWNGYKTNLRKFFASDATSVSACGSVRFTTMYISEWCKSTFFQYFDSEKIPSTNNNILCFFILKMHEMLIKTGHSTNRILYHYLFKWMMYSFLE